jgi:hypothetical protein
MTDELRQQWYREMAHRFDRTRSGVDGDGGCLQVFTKEELNDLAAHFGRLALGAQDDKSNVMSLAAILEQNDLSDEAAKVLWDNMWKLYD